MNLASVIQSFRAAWTEGVPSVNLYLQLAPESTQVPFAVSRFGAISVADPVLSERDFEASVSIVAYTSTDTELFPLIDMIVNTFDRTRYAGAVYSSLLQSVSFDVNYTDQGAFWSAEMSFALRWSQEIGA